MATVNNSYLCSYEQIQFENFRDGAMMLFCFDEHYPKGPCPNSMYLGLRYTHLDTVTLRVKDFGRSGYLNHRTSKSPTSGLGVSMAGDGCRWPHF